MPCNAPAWITCTRSVVENHTGQQCCHIFTIAGFIPQSLTGHAPIILMPCNTTIDRRQQGQPTIRVVLYVTHHPIVHAPEVCPLLIHLFRETTSYYLDFSGDCRIVRGDKQLHILLLTVFLVYFISYAVFCLKKKNENYVFVDFSSVVC